MIYWLPTVLTDYLYGYSKIELILKSVEYNHVSDQLKKGDIDVAVVMLF